MENTPSFWKLGGKKTIFEFSPNFKETVKAIVEGIAMLYKEGKNYSYLSPSTIVFYENDKDLKTPIFLDLFDESIITRFETPKEIRPYPGKKMEKTPSFWGSSMKQEEEAPKTKFLLEERDPAIKGFLVQLQDMGNLKSLSLSTIFFFQHPCILQKEYIRPHIERVRETNLSHLGNSPDFKVHVCRGRDWKAIALQVPHLKIMLNCKGAKYRGDMHGLVSLCRNTFVHLEGNLKEASPKDQDIIVQSGTWSSMDPKMYILDEAEISKLFDETVPRFFSILFHESRSSG